MSSHYKPNDKLKQTLTTQEGNKITIKPKALSVTWGKDSRYWEINENEKEEGSITLNQVSWLEVTGSFPTQALNGGKYNLKFTVSLKTNAFGWQGSPVYFFVLNPKTNKRVWKKKDLSTLTKGGNEDYVPTDLNFEFSPELKNQFPQINFGLYEIWKGGWKGGLEIKEVVIVKIN